jgi:hypothetical protein
VNAQRARPETGGFFGLTAQFGKSGRRQQRRFVAAVKVEGTLHALP